MDQKCFLCQNPAPKENVCKLCDQDIFFCSEAHYKAHRGFTKKGTEVRHLTTLFY